jgi:hypothetical protein
MIYKQCVLRKYKDDSSYSELVSFIPDRFSNVGETLKLKNNDVWEDGWKVISVGAALEEKNLPDSHKAIKQHRKATGDAEPKRMPKRDN